jgi:hypothetical protein
MGNRKFSSWAEDHFSTAVSGPSMAYQVTRVGKDGVIHELFLMYNGPTSSIGDVIEVHVDLERTKAIKACVTDSVAAMPVDRVMVTEV